MADFHVGQKVMRYMGAAGGYWAGTVRWVEAGRVDVLFGDDGGITISFDIDEHLVAADDPSLPERIEAAARAGAEASKVIDTPQWPEGAFD